MKRLKRLVYNSLLILTAICSLSISVFAVTEAEVEAQVAAIGKEGVAGNVLIWFLCAVAFLKISQKIDSFMSSLGINVGHTGGSMLGEAMIAARGIGAIKGISGNGRYSGNGGSSNGGSQSHGGSSSGSAGGFLAGGLAGVVSRQVTSGAIQSVTNNDSNSGLISPGVIGGKVYSNSIANGGRFANDVIGTIATGNIRSMGTITGQKAEEALQSYMGYAANGSNSESPVKFSNVEIGGGRITGMETSAEHPEGIAFGMYSTDQYVAPDGEYSKVFSADGHEWYKQYAVDTVERLPYEAPDETVAYLESITKKLPPVPYRKDKL